MRTPSHPIPFDNSYAQLPDRFFVPQKPAHVPRPQLIRVNDTLATSLSIDPNWLLSPDGVGMLSGNSMPTGAHPLAQAYAGHQFGRFVPQLGDGRAILLGEVIDTDGIRRDIQLKGSGQTAFSRGGDGKSALGPVLREYIVSEAMFALGVPTTRALAAVVTGETVIRHDGAHSAAIFTRIASSHLRVGTFQYFAARKDTDAIRHLADYAIHRHYPECLDVAPPSSPAIYLAFLKSVMQAQASLVAHWMSLGFIHGVMNTDNSSISGETIDYGPCAFLDIFHPDTVFSSIDVRGRYAWGNQPNIAHWNLSRLAETLLPLIHDKIDVATEQANATLDTFGTTFTEQYMSRFRRKLGLSDMVADSVLQDALSLLANHRIDFTLFFRHLTQLASGGDPTPLRSLFNIQEPLNDWLTEWRLAPKSDRCLDEMRASNPILIPRNHRIEAAIQHASSGDYQPFHRLVDALSSPYSENPDNADLEQPPEPDEIVTETFCGT